MEAAAVRRRGVHGCRRVPDGRDRCAVPRAAGIGRAARCRARAEQNTRAAVQREPDGAFQCRRLLDHADGRGRLPFPAGTCGVLPRPRHGRPALPRARVFLRGRVGTLALQLHLQAPQPAGLPRAGRAQGGPFCGQLQAVGTLRAPFRVAGLLRGTGPSDGGVERRIRSGVPRDGVDRGGLWRRERDGGGRVREGLSAASGRALSRTRLRLFAWTGKSKTDSFLLSPTTTRGQSANQTRATDYPATPASADPRSGRGSANAAVPAISTPMPLVVRFSSAWPSIPPPRQLHDALSDHKLRLRVRKVQRGSGPVTQHPREQCGEPIWGRGDERAALDAQTQRTPLQGCAVHRGVEEALQTAMNVRST